jgi:hypothetical protein
MNEVLTEIRNERIKQIEKGYTPEHDDRHSDGALVKAACCYAMGYKPYTQLQPDETLWPFAQADWRPEGARANLIKAAAMLVAEIERIDRDDKPKGLK